MKQTDNVIQQQLLELKQELELASAMGAQARATVALDQQSIGRLSRMDAIQQQAIANAQETRRQHDLTRIDMALRLLAEGGYGCCAHCGEDIAPKRLQIDPLATLCIRCAGK